MLSTAVTDSLIDFDVASDNSAALIDSPGEILNSTIDLSDNTEQENGLFTFLAMLLRRQGGTVTFSAEETAYFRRHSGHGRSRDAGILCAGSSVGCLQISIVEKYDIPEIFVESDENFFDNIPPITYLEY